MFSRAKHISLSLILALTLSAAIFSSALADGIIIPDPPPVPDPISLEESWLTIRYHRVSVTIKDQIAVTRVKQEFLNEHGWEVEGTYVFPLPAGAAVSEFAIWADGVRLESEILPADQARMIYEDIVRERKDPALLEYIGKDAVQARIFPIPPGGSRVVELEYSQVLEMDGGLVRYLYPLNTEKFSARYLEECSLRVELVSPLPIRSVYSPTHQDRADVLREGEFQAVIGYEEYDVLPDQDFELIYTVSEEDVGLNLLTVPDLEGNDLLGEEGYFLFLAAPSLDVDRIVPRDIVLVLDTSGSMEGGKLEQAKAAAVYVLDHLNPEDRFNVIAFSTGVKRFARDLEGASQASRAAAWIEGMQALGGTNINQALLEALSLSGMSEMDSRPRVLLFLTDGLPTEGVTEIDQILANIRSAGDSSLRLFSFGVGDDVNTELLDTLAEKNRGQVSYVRSGERIDEEVSGLYAKIQTPVLTDLEIDFGDVMVEEIYPPQLPDLFAGSQLLVAGRYRLPAGGSGTTTIRLSGSVDSRRESYTYTADFYDQSGNQNSFIPRLWAARKIGYLLNQIRHQGENQEWVEAVIQLSLRFGIITPYTSFLMVEEDLTTSEGWDEAARQLGESYGGPASGAEAVEKADAESNLRSAESVPQAQPSITDDGWVEGEPAVRFVGGKSFFLRDGIWADSQFNREEMTPLQVAFGSEAYFQVLKERPEWGAYLALGDRVVFVGDGQAYEIVPEGEGVSSLPGLIHSGGDRESNPGGRGSGIVPPSVRSLCSAPLLAGLVLLGSIKRRS